MRRRIPVFAAAFFSLAGLWAGSASGQIPDEFTNLKLLDENIEKRQLIGTMRNWANGLGVRCNHCHVGPDNLVGMDFASDEKATKRTARRMLEMSRAVNGELLADLPVVEEGGSHQVVSCYTCHRGQAKPPRNIVVELGGIAQAEGVDAALERYDELRAEHYGSGVYNFSEQALSEAAVYLMQAGQPAGAIKVFEKNLEHNPGSADSQAMIGLVHLETGDPVAARAAFEKALEMDPESRTAQRGMQALAAQAEPAED